MSRQIERLKESIEAGNYYEAHQQYKTLCIRYCKQKKYDQASELIYSGALELLKKQKLNSGVDLIDDLFDIWKQAESQVTKTLLDNVESLYNAFPKWTEQEDESTSQDRAKFVKLALKWAKLNDARDAGTTTAEISHVLGMCFYRDKMYKNAYDLFLAGHTASAARLGIMIHEWTEADSKQDAPRLLAQATFQYLSQNLFKCVTLLFTSFFHPSNKPTPATTPLKTIPIPNETPTGSIDIYPNPWLNISQWAFSVLRRKPEQGGKDLWVTLVGGEYKALLLAYPDIATLIDQIGFKYCGTRVLMPEQANPLGNIMQMMFGGGGAGSNGGNKQQRLR